MTKEGPDGAEKPRAFSVHPEWLTEVPEPHFKLEDEYEALRVAICCHLIHQRRLNSQTARAVEDALRNVRGAVRTIHDMVGAGLIINVHASHNYGGAA